MTQDKKRILFDFSDLVDFVRTRSVVSGIQRVQIDLFNELKKRGDIQVIPVYFCEITKRYLAINADLLLSFDKNYINRLHRKRSRLGRRILRLLRRFRSTSIKSGDVVFVSGAGWTSQRRLVYLTKLEKRVAFSVSWMFYDLIPVSHPEFTSEGNVRQFRFWLDRVIHSNAIFYCISNYSRDELIAYAFSRGTSLRAITVPLAHQLLVPNTRIRHELLYLKNERFVLCVGTLEIRKNHFALIQVWEKLYRERGHKMPLLVLVGAKGWLIDRLMLYLNATHFLSGKIIHIANADDQELGWLYEHCDFTVYPSLVEGWGLPVGESLWFGKPCICYRHTSLPEVGREFAVYCEPGSYESLETAIRKGIDGSFSSLPPPRSSLRTWDFVAQELVQHLVNVANHGPAKS